MNGQVAKYSLLAALLAALVFHFGTSTAQPPPDGEEPSFQDVFRVSPRDLQTRGENEYFIPLTPGFKLLLQGEDEGETVTLLIEVLARTKVVDGVRCAIVQEREWVGDEIVEISLNYVAISRSNKSIFYFGEDVDIFEDGEIVSHEGAWLSGQNDARFGLLMPGYPVVGSRYFQEIAPGVALDRAEHLSVTETVETPADTFENCLLVRETTPLEPGAESLKAYAPGIGLVQDGILKLVDFGRRVKLPEGLAGE